MKFLPLPKKITETGASFFIGPQFVITLDEACGSEQFHAAKQFRTELCAAVCTEVSIEKAARPVGPGLFLRLTEGGEAGAYRLTVTSAGAELSGGSAGLFWGLQTLRQLVRQCGAQWPGLVVEDAPGLQTRGFFYDVTRGQVPTLQTLKDLADRLSFYKINQLQIYVEHTFAWRGFSEAWTGKDPLTAEEILELDEYCRARHIELVPSIATFGHLYEILKTKTFRRFCELEIDDAAPFAWYDRMAHHTLDASNPESLQLVKDLLDQYLPLFTSKQFNIGCDETFDIGCGKSAALAEKVGKDRVYVDFLKEIIAYVQSKGKKVFFWSDIILKSPQYLRELPKGTTCLYWNYGRNINEQEVKTIAESGIDFMVCPGVCGWNMMMNILDGAYENILQMAKYGTRYGAKGMLNTDWGDFGHINLFGSSMPGMATGAALSWNPDDRRDWPEIGRAYARLEFGEASEQLMELLTELEMLQVGTWQDVVCWRESQLLSVARAQQDCERILHMDADKALSGYKKMRELEKQLVGFTAPESRRTDLQEFLCAARGAALMNAACLALKKYAYHVEDTPLALDCGTLAVELELWLRRFGELWRMRNRESELNRIRTTIQDLCAFLRDCACV
ncbi:MULTISPECIES: beta-N-acetylhexosaminidase [Caproicibacterium]|uniref:beta-N-acetylhexosaminidase n=1 Tax=Caproicibacterium argilliputei TaxID=3030016 RepID=A0AA97D9Y8_9FIRM|nr:family 20 glycosylhydrolase [Caproicibacterium argilliputei]WOC32484.1 family 20 glycosylhydrolase [Caproicibacterium argilliputei]